MKGKIRYEFLSSVLPNERAHTIVHFAHRVKQLMPDGISHNSS